MRKALLFNLMAAISMTSFAADPYLLSGRWHKTNDYYAATWPGVTMSAQFIGQSIGITLNDERSFYAVEIDGKVVQQISPHSGKRTVWLKNLSTGAHRIDLIRRNESPDYVGRVYGFVLDGGQWQAAPAAPARKIEFIGDSFTAALANLSTTRECSDKEIGEKTDISQGFAVKVARSLGAQWQINAMSGMGLVRNWNGNLADRDFRGFYPRLLQTEARSIAADKEWQPQLVVIGLGVNDFSTPVNSGEARNAEQLGKDFQAAYRKLIAQLNARDPKPQLILTAMKLWPDDRMRPMIQGIVDAERLAGNDRIHYVELAPMELTACQWHPNLNDHQQVANQLLEKIKTLPLAW